MSIRMLGPAGWEGESMRRESMRREPMVFGWVVVLGVAAALFLGFLMYLAVRAGAI